MERLNPFWKDTISIWLEEKELLEEEYDAGNCHVQYLSQPLYHNREIKIGGKPVFIKHWFQQGIQFINDVISNQGRVFSWEEFSVEHEVKGDYVTYYGLISAIPKQWLAAIERMG